MAHQNSGRRAFVYPYGPESEEKLDTMPSDKQPPGVDEKPYESLEEALLGE